MTNEEARDICRRALKYIDYKYTEQKNDAVLAIIEQAVENEDIKIMLDAVEKQIPKKPIDLVDEYYDMVLGCPCCAAPIINVWSKEDYKPKYCHRCGQAIDWSDNT